MNTENMQECEFLCYGAGTMVKESLNERGFPEKPVRSYRLDGPVWSAHQQAY